MTNESSIGKPTRITFTLCGLVAIATAILYGTLDLPAAIYAKYELPKALVKFAKHFDDLDDYILILFAILAATAWFKLKNKELFRKFLFPLAAALTSGIAVHILKPLFGRWRPKGYFKYEEYGFEFFQPVKSIMASYPSGHSTSIMAIMTAVALLFPRWRVPCFIFAACVASVRVIVSAHYPSDVIAGLALGYLSTRWLAYHLAKRNLLPDPLAVKKQPSGSSAKV